MIFNSRTDAIIWIIKNQFGRRNLENYVRASLILKPEDIFIGKAKENERLSSFEKQVEKKKDGHLNSDNQMTKNNQVNTNKELANLAGVGHDTISKVKEINKDMPPEVKEDMEKKINSGDISINQAHKAVRSVKN
jgi:hypothetical protein